VELPTVRLWPVRGLDALEEPVDRVDLDLVRSVRPECAGDDGVGRLSDPPWPFGRELLRSSWFLAC
jgi:hypothetical protein